MSWENEKIVTQILHKNAKLNMGTGRMQMTPMGWFDCISHRKKTDWPKTKFGRSGISDGKKEAAGIFSIARRTADVSAIPCGVNWSTGLFSFSIINEKKKWDVWNQ